MTEKLIEVTGYHGGTIYYSTEEKHLYVKRGKTRKGGEAYLACYDTILDKPNSQCPAKRVYTKVNGHSRSTNPLHSNHENHEIIYKDLISINNVKNHCRYLAENFPTSAHKVSIKEIFLLEMAKYVLF